MILAQLDNAGGKGSIPVIGNDRIGIFREVNGLVVHPGIMRCMVNREVVPCLGPGIVGPKGLNRFGVLDPVTGPILQVVLPCLACLGRIQFAIGNQLRLPGIVDGSSRRCGGGNQFPGNRAHDLVDNSNLPTPFCHLIGGIILGMALAILPHKKNFSVVSVYPS